MSGNMDLIKFNISENDMKTIENKLSHVSWKTPTIVKDAVNDTAKQARNTMLQKAKDKYVIKSGRFRGKSKIKGATYNNTVATIIISGQVNEIMDYRATPSSPSTRRKSGVKGKILKSSSLKALEVKDQDTNLKAFVTKFSNGKVAVVQRVPGKEYVKSEKISERQRKYGKKADVTKIKKILSPSLPKIIGGKEGVYNELNGHIESVLATNLYKNIQKFMRNE